MSCVLFLILDQKTVILRNCSLKKILLLNKAFAERTAYKASGYKSEGRCGCTYCSRTLYIEIFKDRTEGSGDRRPWESNLCTFL